MTKAFLLPFVVSGMFSYGLAASAAAAPSSAELTCRANAKEVAATAYRSCITESKQAQIDQIRKEYQKRLADLKNHYDKELKKLSGKAATQGGTDGEDMSANTEPAQQQTSLPPKATKGVAKALPTRQERVGATPPVQQIQEGTATVAVPSGRGRVSGEDTRTQAEEPTIEILPSSDERAAAREAYPDGQ